MAASPTAGATSTSELPTPTLLFDGDCGFCTTSAGWLRRLAPAPSLDVVPSWSVDFGALGLTLEDVTRCVWFIAPDGSLAAAEAGIAGALRQSPYLPVRAIGRVLGFGPLQPVTGRVYRLVAANRYRLPGSTDACRIDTEH